MSCKISKDYYDKLNMKKRLIKYLVYFTTASFALLFLILGWVFFMCLMAMIRH